MLRYGCFKPKGEYLHSGYLHTKFSQSDNNSRVPTCLRVQCTFSASVPVLTTTSVPGFTNNCNNPSSESHTWPACDTAQLSKFRSKKKHENKLTAKFPVSFQVQFKTVSTSYTVQVVSIDLQYYMLNSNTSTTAAQTTDATWCIWEIKINVPKQVVSTCLSLSLRCQPTVSTPSSTVPSVPWRFLSLSLSALQYLYCQANHNASGFNFKVTSQCKHPSSPTVPAHYRTSGVQLLTSYLTHLAIQFFHEPRSLTKQTRPSRSSCHSFSLSAKITKLSSDSPGSRCQSHHHNLSLSSDSPGSLSLAKVTKLLTQPKCRSHMQRNCNTLSHAAQSLSPIFPRLPLLSGTPSPISTTYLIQHWGHRYFNLPVPCGICLRYAHASHKPASASRLPNPWDGLWASL